MKFYTMFSFVFPRLSLLSTIYFPARQQKRTLLHYLKGLEKRKKERNKYVLHWMCIWQAFFIETSSARHLAGIQKGRAKPSMQKRSPSRWQVWRFWHATFLRTSDQWNIHSLLHHRFISCHCIILNAADGDLKFLSLLKFPFSRASPWKKLQWC